MAMASKIEQFLNKILSNRYGKDVRQAIHDGIKQCYSDVTNPDLNVDAFETAVQNKIDDGSLALLTIPDGSITKEKLDQDTNETIEKHTEDITDLKSDIEVKGLSSIEKQLILNLLKNAAYVSDSMNGVITALENMFNKTGKLYEMTARTFDGTGSSVDTGIRLFSSDISFTITVDAEIDNIDDIDVWRLFSCMSSSNPWSGITVQSDGSVNTQLQWSTRKEAGKYIPSLDSGRVRVVLSHVEGSNKAIYYIKYNDDTMNTVTISSVMIPQDENLYIGGNKTNCCWKGEISSFILYDHVLSSEEINTFMS